LIKRKKEGTHSEGRLSLYSANLDWRRTVTFKWSSYFLFFGETFSTDKENRWVFLPPDLGMVKLE
jgi:hypothetical protein